MKEIFYITFGQRSPFSNGWVEVRASNEEEARKEAFEVFGQHWSNIYSKEKFQPEYFSQGKLGRTIEAL